MERKLKEMMELIEKIPAQNVELKTELIIKLVEIRTEFEMVSGLLKIYQNLH